MSIEKFVNFTKYLFFETYTASYFILNLLVLRNKLSSLYYQTKRRFGVRSPAIPLLATVSEALL